MSAGFIGINIKEALSIPELGEEKIKKFLSDFYCPFNSDVEDFLKYKSIEFAKQGIAMTHLIMASYKGEYVLCGYFTIASKVMLIDKESTSKSLSKRIAKFSEYNQETKNYSLSAPLIGQLGKNYQNDYNKLISGDELLKLAIDKVIESQMIVGGKFVYLECEDVDKLKEFYENNGFVDFGKRNLDKEEIGTLKGKYLVQMLKYLK